MARKRAGKAKKAKKPAREPMDGERLMRLMSTGTTVVLLVLLVGGLALGRRAMRERVAEIHRTPVQVAFQWPRLQGAGASAPATWLDDASRRNLTALAATTLTADRFDGSSLAATSEALMQTGWFTEPCRIDRDPDGTVHIAGRWRIPTAVVRADGRDHLVSRDARRLALNYAPGTSGRKVILGVESAIPALGAAWRGGRVQDAIDLLDYLKELTGFDQIAAIDTGAMGDQGRLVIVTDRAYRIVWGGPVNEFNPGEANPDVKRRRLIGLFDQFGRIDADTPFVDVSLIPPPEIDRTARPRPSR